MCRFTGVAVKIFRRRMRCSVTLHYRFRFQVKGLVSKSLYLPLIVSFLLKATALPVKPERLLLVLDERIIPNYFGFDIMSLICEAVSLPGSSVRILSAYLIASALLLWL